LGKGGRVEVEEDVEDVVSGGGRPERSEEPPKAEEVRGK